MSDDSYRGVHSHGVTTDTTPATANAPNLQKPKRGTQAYIDAEIARAKRINEDEALHRQELARIRAQLGDAECDRRIALFEKRETMRRSAERAVWLAVACSKRAYVVDGVLVVEGTQAERFTEMLAPFNTVVPDRGVSYAACIAESLYMPAEEASS